MRADKSQAGIVAALVAFGCSVEVVEGRGGRPDLLVGYRGVTLLIECKSPGHDKKTGSAKKHLAKQEAWRAAWRGGPVFVVETPAQACDAVLLAVLGGQQP